VRREVLLEVDPQLPVTPRLDAVGGVVPERVLGLELEVVRPFLPLEREPEVVEDEPPADVAVLLELLGRAVHVLELGAGGELAAHGALGDIDRVGRRAGRERRDDCGQDKMPREASHGSHLLSRCGG